MHRLSPPFLTPMRVLATFSGSFAAGIFLVQYCLPVSWTLPASLLCLLLSWLALLLPEQMRRRSVLIGAGLAVALGWNWLYIRQVQQPMLALENTQQAAEMTLCGYATQTNYGAKVPVKLSGFTHGKVLYYGDSSLLELEPGQTVQDLVQFKSAAHIKDEDITTFTSKGIYLLAYQRGNPSYGVGTSDQIRWLPAHMSRKMQTQIQELFKGDVAAFLTAILTGDKHLLSEKVSISLSEAGLFHILAVSGMHCGFLLAMVTLLVGKHRRRLLALCTIPLLLFYAALTGGSPSVLRACLMLTLFVIAPLVNRDSDGWTSLLFALFLILLKNPFAAASVSLQLSFGAMSGILFVTPRLYSMLSSSKKHRKLFYLTVTGFSTTIGAMFFTTPLCALYFSTLSLISPVSNLLCLWAASLVFTLGLFVVMVSFFCMPLAMFIGIVPSLLAQYILKTADLLSAIPYHAVYFSNSYLKLWLGFVYLLFAAAFFLGPKQRRKYVLAASISVGTLLLTISLGSRRYQADLDAFVLDIGQGQCVLLASHGDFALLDCGSAQMWKNPGKAAADQLCSMGCTKLDYLLLTHYDTDHVSGVSGLMARLPVETLLIPATEDDAGLREQILDIAAAHMTTVQEVTSLEQHSLGRATLTIYPPLGTSGDNERGLSCLASVGEQDLLVTGDMGSSTERILLDTYSLPDIEALVAGHHGSKSSTSSELLEQLSPEIVCISAGKGNRYHHPADETLLRLAQYGCFIYRTDLHGTIHLTFNQGDHNGI